mmetsp:Transcript_70225/g.142149  ORF Transcript_70225/g.142149 Transcript_70225/m.142149 type:complete len:200 (-) Transcript_70225:794-1393(-)
MHQPSQLEAKADAGAIQTMGPNDVKTQHWQNDVVHRHTGGRGEICHLYEVLHLRGHNESHQRHEDAHRNADRSAGDPAPRQQGFSGHHRHGHIDGIGAQQVKRESPSQGICEASGRPSVPRIHRGPPSRKLVSSMLEAVDDILRTQISEDPVRSQHDHQELQCHNKESHHARPGQGRFLPHCASQSGERDHDGKGVHYV